MSAIKRLANRIEKENALFFAMSKDEKKVVVAKDCIARIKLNQFKVNKGLIVDYSIKKVVTTNSLKTALNSEDFPTCQVCAKGGLFMSYVGRTNDFIVCDISGDNHKHSSEHKKLLEIFTLRELCLIEYAFEGEQYIHYDENAEKIDFTKKERIKIQKYYARYGGSFNGDVNKIDEFNSFSPYNDSDNKDNRLMAICRNIIRNNGTFTI